MEEEYLEYIKENSILSENLNIDFSDHLFAYDYNEVQELLFEPNTNNFVFLVGEANLRKNDMLARVCKDLYERGINKSDILYLNLELPIFENFNFKSYCKKWSVSKKSHRVYLIINELQMIGNWSNFISFLKEECKNVQLICSSTTAKMIYETLYEINSNANRVVVLSQKNDSNIKYITQGFGVYNNELKYNIKNNVVEIKGMTKEGKKMSHHVIPNTIEGFPVKIIASGAFHDRSEMLSIELPDSIEMIGDYAFTKCVNLKSIRLPKNVKYLGENAFLGDVSLEEFIGGDFITHIGNSALYKTKWLDNHKNEDFIVLGKTLYEYRGKKSNLEIPHCIETIANYAFKDSNIVNIKLNGQKLMEGVFYNCKRLKSISGFDDEKIPAFTFYNCKKLVNFDSEFYEVGKFAFYGCETLMNVKGINLTVHQAGFENCKLLTNVGIVSKALNAAFANSNINYVSPQIEYIGKFAYFNTKTEKIFIPDCYTIDDYAFASSKIKTANFSPDITIGKKVLFDCKNVKSMEISGSMKVSYYFGETPHSIEELSVYGDIVDDFNRNNIGLKKLYLQNVQQFGRWSFYNNNNLEEIKFLEVINIGDWAFAYCEKLKKIVLPKELKHIGLNGFRYCHILSDITLESKEMVTFGNNAFYSTGESKEFKVPSVLVNKYKEHRIWKEYSKNFKAIRD